MGLPRSAHAHQLIGARGAFHWQDGDGGSVCVRLVCARARTPRERATTFHARAHCTPGARLTATLPPFNSPPPLPFPLPSPASSSRARARQPFPLYARRVMTSCTKLGQERAQREKESALQSQPAGSPCHSQLFPRTRLSRCRARSTVVQADSACALFARGLHATS